MGCGNRVGTGPSYRPGRLHMLAEFISWNRFMGSIKVVKFGLWLDELRDPSTVARLDCYCKNCPEYRRVCPEVKVLKIFSLAP
jgi:hypothetical protein